MRQTIRLGRVAGIPVGVHWTVLAIMVLLVQGLALSVLPAAAPDAPVAGYWITAILATAAFMGLLLAHELGHALVAQHYGVRVRAITLWLLGGVSELSGPAPHARAELLTALAGPLVSLAGAALFGTAAVLAVLSGAGPLVVAALTWLAVINALLAVFNLLPGAPLDGGRVLAAALWWLRGDRAAARRAAARTGSVLGILLVAAGTAEVFLAADVTGLWLVLLGWFLSSAARAESVDATLGEGLSAVPVAQVMSTPPVCGYAHQTATAFVVGTAQHYPYQIFPVLDLDGRLAGMVSLARLGRIPQAERDSTPLRAVLVPAARLEVLAPTDSLADAARRLAGRSGLAVVADQGRVCGVLGAGDVTRAIELINLGIVPGRDPAGAAPCATP